MALLHWYIIPIGLEVGFSPIVLENFSYFVDAVEMATTIKSRSKQELVDLHNLLRNFLEGFQRIYIGDHLEKVSRFRLCIFQLIHVPMHIEWNGSIQVGSQATVERAIGDMGHKIQSKKAPFANLANIILERELIKLLLLWYPLLMPSKTQGSKISPSGYVPQSEIKIQKKEQSLSGNFYDHLQAICHHLNTDLNFGLELRRWGKVHLPEGTMLRSRLNETRGKQPTRSACYFEAQKHEREYPVFGEALAFFEVISIKQLLVVYRPLGNCHQILRKWRGVWLDNIKVLPVSEIQRKVGIWSYGEHVYILRKHPGILLLTGEEVENDDGDDEDNENEPLLL